MYRYTLEREGISLLPRRDGFPVAISGLVERVGRRRSSPGPSARDILHDLELQDLEGGFKGASESRVQQVFQQRIFPPRDTKGPLDLSVQLPILAHAVPRSADTLDRPEKKGIIRPVPDLLYGYRLPSFTLPQQGYLEEIGSELQATTQQLYCPFFLVEFKGESGMARVATNQCLGGSACCVNITERLNQRLEACTATRPGVQMVDGAVFSVGMDGNMARLFVSWQREDRVGYCTARVRDFAVQEPSQYVDFRTYVRNIIDWGRNERRQQICVALDVLADEQRRTAAAARITPQDGPGIGGSSESGRRVSARLGSRS